MRSSTSLKIKNVFLHCFFKTLEGCRSCIHHGNGLPGYMTTRGHMLNLSSARQTCTPLHVLVHVAPPLCAPPLHWSTTGGQADRPFRYQWAERHRNQWSNHVHSFTCTRPSRLPVYVAEVTLLRHHGYSMGKLADFLANLWSRVLPQTKYTILKLKMWRIQWYIC